MKVKDLIAELQRLPPEAPVELSRLLAIDTENADDAYEMRLDLPIIGIAHAVDEKEADVLLVVEYIDNDQYRNMFGTLHRFGEKTSDGPLQ